MLRSGQLPTLPLVLYAAGAVPVALRAAVPEAALDLGLVVMAVGIAWLATSLCQRADGIAGWRDHEPKEVAVLAG